MKKNRENKKIWLLAFFLITAVSIFIRFYHYRQLLDFTIDPPFHLQEVKEMVDSRKLRLIGPMLQSKLVNGRGFFIGPFYYYVLAILGIFSKWNIVFMTAFFTLFWIWTYIILFFWLKHRFGKTIALTVYIFLSFWFLPIPLSRMIWNPHFIPLFGTLFLMFLDFRKKRNFFLFSFRSFLGNCHKRSLHCTFLATNCCFCFNQ